MSESNYLTSVEKDNIRNFQFETDSSSNSMDIGDQIIIPNITCEDEEENVEKETHKNRNTNEHCVQIEREKDKTDIDTKWVGSEVPEKQIDEPGESLENDEIWDEEEPVLVLRNEDDEDNVNEKEAVPNVNIHSKDEDNMYLVQEVLDIAKAGDERVHNDEALRAQEMLDINDYTTKTSDTTMECNSEEESKETEICLASAEHENRLLADNVNESKIDIDKKIEDQLPSSLSENVRHLETMDADEESEGIKKGIQISLKENIELEEESNEDTISNEVEAQNISELSQNRQSKCTNDIAEDNTNKTEDIIVLKENAKDSSSIRKEIPDTTTPDYEHQVTHTFDNTENEKEEETHNKTDSNNTIGNEIPMESNNVEMKWESDTNTSEWEGMFEHDTKEKDSQNEAESQGAQKGEVCAIIQKENINNGTSDITFETISSKIPSDNLDVESRDINLSSDENDRSENIEINSEDIVESKEASQITNTFRNGANQETALTLNNVIKEEQSKTSMKGDSENIYYLEDHMHVSEIENEDVNKEVQNEETEMGNANIENAADETDSDQRPTSGQKRENEFDDNGSGKKSMRNIERVRQKLEEIMEKSKIEEDMAIAELKQMKQEKAEILKSITEEMETLKSLLGQGKARRLKKLA